jgi:hypothetical protein
LCTSLDDGRETEICSDRKNRERLHKKVVAVDGMYRDFSSVIFVHLIIFRPNTVGSLSSDVVPISIKQSDKVLEGWRRVSVGQYSSLH